MRLLYLMREYVDSPLAYGHRKQMMNSVLSHLNGGRIVWSSKNIRTGHGHRWIIWDWNVWFAWFREKISCTDYRGWYDCYTVCGRSCHEYPLVCKTGEGNLPWGYRWKCSIWELEYCIPVKNESGRRTNIGAATLICANNEPKTVLAWLWRLSW